MICLGENRYSNAIIYGVIFLIGLNFKANALMLVYLLSMYIILFIRRASIVTVKGIYPLIVFFGIVCSVYIKSIEADNAVIIRFLLLPLLFYTFYNVGIFNIERSESIDTAINYFFRLFFFFSLGNMIHMYLDVSISNIGNMGVVRRVINDIWTQGTAPTTIMVGWGCLLIPLFLYAWDNKKKMRFTFYVLTILNISYIAISFAIATRLGVVNTVIVLILYLFFRYFQKDISININATIKFFFGVVIGGLILYKILPLIISSNLYLRISSSSVSILNSNGRLEAAEYLIRHFFNSMWGGEYFTKTYGLQQHNILLQMYDLYGIIAFVGLAVIILSSLKIVLRILKYQEVSAAGKRFINLFYFALIIYCFEEPAITSNFIITSMLFAFYGYICAIEHGRRLLKKGNEVRASGN